MRPFARTRRPYSRMPELSIIKSKSQNANLLKFENSKKIAKSNNDSLNTELDKQKNFGIAKLNPVAKKNNEIASINAPKKPPKASVNLNNKNKTLPSRSNTKAVLKSSGPATALTTIEKSNNNKKSPKVITSKANSGNSNPELMKNSRDINKNKTPNTSQKNVNKALLLLDKIKIEKEAQNKKLLDLETKLLASEEKFKEVNYKLEQEIVAKKIIQFEKMQLQNSKNNDEFDVNVFKSKLLKKIKKKSGKKLKPNFISELVEKISPFTVFHIEKAHSEKNSLKSKLDEIVSELGNSLSIETPKIAKSEMIEFLKDRVKILQDAFEAERSLVVNLKNSGAEQAQTIAYLNSKISDLTIELDATKSLSNQYLATIEQKNNEIELVKLHVIDAQNELKSHKEALSSVLSSTSWKATQWLRDVKDVKNGNYKTKNISQTPDSFEKITDQYKHLITPKPKFTFGTGRVNLHKNLRISAIGDGPIPSVILGAILPLTQIAINHDGEFSIHYDHDFSIEEVLANSDIVFMKRICTKKSLDAARRIKAANIPLIYMIDDDFSELPKDTPLGRRYAELRAWENITEICKIADRVIVWSRPLEAKLKQYAKRVDLFRAFSNVEIFSKFKNLKPQKRNNLVFGYAGGSTHAPDLEMIKEPILAILNAYPTIKFETVGLKIDWLEGNPQYEYFEGDANMEKYYRIVASRNWDFGVAPLAEKAINNAKSDNKLREYAAAGIPAIYSRVPSYRDAVQEGVTGLLCANSNSDWLQSIRKFIEDKDLRDYIKHEGKKLASERYGRDAVIRQYELLIKEYCG